MNDQIALKLQWPVLIAAGCAVGLLSLWALSANSYSADVMPGAISKSPESPESPGCASLARAVANRNPSMMEGTAARSTVEQAYRICAADPGAFRRMVR